MEFFTIAPRSSQQGSPVCEVFARSGHQLLLARVIANELLARSRCRRAVPLFVVAHCQSELRLRAERLPGVSLCNDLSIELHGGIEIPFGLLRIDTFFHEFRSFGIGGMRRGHDGQQGAQEEEH